MARVYKNHIHLYSGLQEFQEKAVRFLNEIYGRQKPLDFVDFAVDEAEKMFIATGWYNGEEAPKEQKPGEPLSVAAQVAINAGTEIVKHVFLKFLEQRAPAPVVAVKPKAPAQDKAKQNGKKRK